MRLKLFCVHIFFTAILPLSTMAQVEDKPEMKSKTKAMTLPGGRPAYYYDRSEILKQLQWNWESLGPDETPPEMNPGGKAIPAYAKGRGNGTGRINYLFLHPEKENCLWACSPTGGLWFTANSGETWVNGGMDRLPVSGASSVAVHKKKIERWVVATGDGDDVFMFSDGLWLTEDAGTSYVSINGKNEEARLPFGDGYPTDGQIGEVVSSFRNLKSLFVASNKGLWINNRTLDPGEILWTKIAEGNFYDIEILQGRSKRKDIIIAAGNKLLISFNGGKKWEEMPLPVYPEPNRYPFLRMSIEVSPAAPYKLFAVVTCSEALSQSSQGEGTLQVFDLKTRKWQMIKSLRAETDNVIPTRARAFAVSPLDPDFMMCGNIQPLYLSEDGGHSFSKIEKNQMHDDCHFIGISKNGTTVWAAHDGGVSVSRDRGLHFETKDKGIGAANVFGLSVAQGTAPQVLFGGYDVGGNLLREKKWQHVSWGDGFETITHPANPSVMFSTMQNGGIQRSIDGTGFESSVRPAGTKTEWHTWIRMHPTNTNTVYCSGTKLMRSRDLGDNWEVIMDVDKMDSTLYCAYRFYLSEEHPAVMYVYVLNDGFTHPQIWRTFNINEPDPQKIIWERVKEVPVDGWIMNICMDPSDPRKFWVLYGKVEREGKVWWFNGEDYEDYTANLGWSRCESMVLQKGIEKRLYIGSNYGVFTRHAGESQWTLLTGLPGTYIKALDINYKAGKLVVGTFGRGIWWGDLIRK